MQKKVKFAICDSAKKSQINHRPPCAAQVSAPGPSLGTRGPNSMVSSNLPSVRSGRLGLASYPDRTVNRAWARNSGLRVARTEPMPDSDSTENFGSYRVSPGRIGYLWAELGTLIFLYRTGSTGNGPTGMGRSVHLAPHLPKLTRRNPI